MRRLALLVGLLFYALGARAQGVPIPPLTTSSVKIQATTGSPVTATFDGTPQSLNALGLAVNILNPLYGALCNGTQSAADTIAANTALAATRTLFIPRTFPNGTSTNCVLDLSLTSSQQSIYGDNTTVTPLQNSNYVFQFSGAFKPHLSGVYINDSNGYTVAKSTLASLVAAGATTVTVGTLISGPAIQVGQRYSIREDTGSYATGYVASVSGSTIGLSDAVPTQASSGNAFWSTFGDVYITGTTQAEVDNVTCNGSWGCLMMDDPSGSGEVALFKIENVLAESGHMFGIVKGRDTHDGYLVNDVLYGGWTDPLAATGNGVTTTFPLPDRLALLRELTSVTVGGVPQTNPANYTVATNGLSITFASAPASGAAIAGSEFTYGADGYFEDGRTGSEGGTNSSIKSLQYDRCLWFKGAYIYTFHDGGGDTCGEDAIVLDGVTQYGTMHNTLAGWGVNNSLHVTNNSGGLRYDGQINQVPASYTATGVQGAEITEDSGSIIADGHMQGTTSGNVYTWQNGIIIECANGGITFFSQGCGTGNDTYNFGTGHAFGINQDGTVASFSAPFSNYLTANTDGGSLTIQANGAGGTLFRQATVGEFDKVGNSVFGIIGGNSFTASGCSPTVISGAVGATGQVQIGATSCNLTVSINGGSGATSTHGWACAASDITAKIPLASLGGNSNQAVIWVPPTAAVNDIVTIGPCQGW
jgi:hypothetical protein